MHSFLNLNGNKLVVVKVTILVTLLGHVVILGYKFVETLKGTFTEENEATRKNRNPFRSRLLKFTLDLPRGFSITGYEQV